MGNKGLHNILEAAVFGIPIIIGKNFKGFSEAEELVKLGGVKSINSEIEFEDIFNKENEAEIDHISLSRWADLIIVLPTTANFMTKLSIGRAEDLATTVLLASNKDILLVP